MAGRIVIHRAPHPTQDKVCSRWFTYKGRDYGLLPGGPGFGWQLFDLSDPVRLPGVSDNYFTLADVREKAASDIERYLYEEQRTKERGW